MLIEIVSNNAGLSKINRIVPEFFTYPDGQQYIKTQLSKIDSTSEVTLTCRLTNFLDVERLFLLYNALDKNLEDMELQTTLNIIYLLGARSDKILNSVNYLEDIIEHIFKAFNFHTINLLDSHSYEGPTALIKGACYVHPLKPTEFHNWILDQTGPCYLIYPDKGANERYNINHPNILGVVTCSKVRDLETGKLSGFDSEELDCKGNNILIVDDICDGGGTFVGILDVLKRKNNIGKAKLAITHGIFSKGQEPLKGFSDIFTTDSFHDPYKLIEMFSERSRISMQSDLLHLQFFHFYNEI